MAGASLILGLLLLTASVRVTAEQGPGTERNFDEYGRINWEAEEAHLDNFAVQLQNDPDLIGYIFIYDGNELCAGEAQARAIRARTYLVDRRGVPANRVIWRHDGYGEKFRIVLQPLNRSVGIPYPFQPSTPGVIRRHVTRGCRARIREIRNPNT